MKATRRSKQLLNSLTQIQSIPEKPLYTKPDLPKLLSWASSIATHPHLYFPMVNDNKTYHYYRVVLQVLEGIELSSIRRKCFLQFSCIMFDISTSTYLGNTFFTQMIQVQGKNNERLPIYCQKSLYVYTALEKVIIKVDIWNMESEKNKNGFQVMVKRNFIGHFDVDLSHTGTTHKKINKNEEQRFFTQHEENEQQQESEHHNKRGHGIEYKVVYQVMNTHSLTYMKIFLPPDLICDENDQIIGLKQGHISQNGQIVSDERSKLRFQIQQITIPRNTLRHFLQSAEQKINLSYQIVGRPTHTLKDILFHIQYHNGWKCVSHQTLTLSQKQSDISMVMTKQVLSSKFGMKSAQKIKESSKNVNLVYHYEKIKELSAVYLKEGGVIIIWLQAKIQLKFDVKVNEKEKKQKHQIVYMPIGFAFRSVSDREEETVQKFQLFQGNPYSHSQVIQYLTAQKQNKKETAMEQKNKIYCELMFYLLKSKEGLQEIGVDAIERDAQQIENLKNQRERLTRLRRKIKEEKRKKLIQINQEIPFLDPTKLKEELYNQKIEKIRSEKQQKEEILFFLKTKVNQLQRQALSLNYNQQGQDTDPEAFKSNLVQKLPQNYIDYKPSQTPINLDQGLTIDIFTTQFNQKIKQLPQLLQKSIVTSFMTTPTYLNIRVTKFLNLREEEIQNYFVFVYDFSGRAHKVGQFSTSYQEDENLSINILVPGQTFQVSEKYLSSLLNGLVPVYIQCGSYKKLTGISLLEAGKLIQSLFREDICSSFINQKLIFRQQQTLLVQLQCVISFSQTYTEKKALDIEQNVSMSISGLGQSHRQSYIANRINRYKQQKGGDQFKAQKEEIISKAIKRIRSEKIRVNYARGVKEVVSLRVSNRSNNVKLMNVNLFDEDQQFLSKTQAKLIIQPAKAGAGHIHQAVTFRNKNTIQLRADTQQFLCFEYLSDRKVVNTNSLFYSYSIADVNGLSYKEYNHIHKITVTLTQSETNIVSQMFQIQICPLLQPNILYLQTFTVNDSQIVLPIPAQGLTVQNNSHDIQLAPTRAVITNDGPLKVNQAKIIQFILAKQQINVTQTVPFQAIQMHLWGSQQHQVQCRLWETQQLLLKIPFQQILQQEVKYGQRYKVEHLKIDSKHIDLTIKSKNQYTYEGIFGFNRKDDEVFIRAKLNCNALGKQIYPVEVSDNYNNVIYRISVTCQVAFPALTPNQIMKLTIPKHNLDAPEYFSYQNKTENFNKFTTKSLRPNLLSLKQKTVQLKAKDTAQLTLMFNWLRIKQELRQEQKDQCHILVGVMSGDIIDYLLFKCRNK